MKASNVVLNSLMLVLVATLPSLSHAQPATANPDLILGTEDSLASGNLLANDDANGAGMILTVVDDPAEGGITTFQSNGNVTYTPPPNVSGDISFTYAMRSLALACLIPPIAPDCTAIGNGVWRIAPDADVPTVVLSDPTGSEDNPVNLGISATLVDTDGSQTETTRINGVPPGATLSAGADQGSGVWLVPTTSVSGVTLTPAADYNGTFTLFIETITIDQAPPQPDSQRIFGHGTLNVTFTPVNDDPQVGTIPALITSEDVDASIDLASAVTDVDIATNGDSLTFTVLSITHPAIDTASFSGSTLDVSLLPDENGTGTVRVRAADSGGGQVAFNVPVDVTDVNDPPVLASSIPDENVDEDDGAQTVDLSSVFFDPDVATDGDSLTLTAVDAGASGLFSAISTGADTLTYTLAADQNGTAVITITATDDAGDAVDALLTVNVAPVNDQPTVAGTVPTLDLVEDIPGSVSLAGVFDDVDILTNGDVLTYSVQSFSHPAIDVASMGGDVLSVTLLANEFGSGTVVVRATDGGGLFEEVTVPVNVTEANDAPYEAAALPVQAVTEDDPPVTVDISGVFVDEDISREGDNLSFTAAPEPGFEALFASYSVTGTDLNVSFAPDQNGIGRLIITATDDAGDSADSTVIFDATPVNDAPVGSSLPTVNMDEDDAPRLVSVDAFTDVDIATNADVLTYSVEANSNPALFDSLAISGSDLTITLTGDANGSATLTIRATDLAGAFDEIDMDVVVAGVNDIPAAAPDTLIIDEDSGPVIIPVIDNDYLAEQPTTLTAVNHTTTFTILDPFGNEVTGPSGTVSIIGNTVEYTPALDFAGTDTFTYTITDNDGDTSVGTVTVTVNQVNDPPESAGNFDYFIDKNTTLSVFDPASGLLAGSYDIEDAVLVDGQLTFPNLVVQILTVPSSGSFSVEPTDGTFTYTPPVDYVGVVTFTFQIFDNTDLSVDVYTATITVSDVAAPPDPPEAGEVSQFFDLSQTPLEQSATVPPNVMVLADDSGSMNFQTTISGGNADGGLTLSNGDIATSNVWSFGILYTVNIGQNWNYYWCCNTAPTEESLEADTNTDGNEYGIWRLRNAQFNNMYYNPEIQYLPWSGEDDAGNDFENAVPTAVRVDPNNPNDTVDITATRTFSSYIPRWETDGGWAYVPTTLYVPRYWTTTATAPLEWDDPHTLVEIRDDGSTYAGGPNRNDCRVGDDDPLTCTYDQEIQNFANYMQFYRNRELAMKGSLGLVLSNVSDLRVGFDTISGRNRLDIADINDLAAKENLVDEVYEFYASGGTPLRNLLDRGAQYLSCTDGGTCPALPEPEGICQQNFALLFTDGYWNGPNTTIGNTDTDGPGPYDGGRYADNQSGTLGDVAMYYYETDMFPAVEDGVPVSTRDLTGVPDGTFGEDDRLHQHIKTYTIAFGATGTIDPDTAKTWGVSNAFAWTDPFTFFQHRLDDVVHAGINGRGDFLSAGNPTELQTSIESAFLEFTQASSSASAAAFNSTSLRDGALLYRGFFDMRERTGELSATSVSNDGVVSTTPTWLASEQLNPASKLPNDRVIVTWDETGFDSVPFRYAELNADQRGVLVEDQLNYIRGDRTQEQPTGPYRRRPTNDGLLGPIVNSAPVFVGEARAFNRDQAPYPIDDPDNPPANCNTSQLYSCFVESTASRPGVVYVGANDGMLHGFSGTTGEELYAYVPNMIIDSTEVYSNKLGDVTSPFYYHNYYVDLSVRLNDVWGRRTPSGSPQWMTTLVGGLRAGGKGYFALDVTDPTTQFADEDAATSTVLWEFTDEDDTPALDADDNIRTNASGEVLKDLGYATSTPVVQMLNSSERTGDERDWGVIFGNGANATSGVATLFVLFHDLGIDGWDSGDFVKLSTGEGVQSTGSIPGYPNGLGSPTAVDEDLNGTVDYVYAGDRLGNLYRFDLTDSDPDQWDVVKLFSATYDTGTETQQQPIEARPLVLKVPNKPGFLVVFGTGGYLTKDDASSSDVQSIYAIWDQLDPSPATASSSTKANNLVERAITNVVDDSGADPQTRRIIRDLADGSDVVLRNPGLVEGVFVDGNYGWYIDLDMERATQTTGGATNPDTSGLAPPNAQYPGERAIRRFVFRNGALITTTVLPATDEFSCFGVRPGSILIMDAFTGGNFGGDLSEPIIDFNQDSEIDEGDLVTDDGKEYSGGLLFDQNDLDGPLVDLSTLGGEGDVDYLFVSGGNDTEAFEIQSATANRTGRLSWVELNGQ